MGSARGSKTTWQPRTWLGDNQSQNSSSSVCWMASSSWLLGRALSGIRAARRRQAAAALGSQWAARRLCG